MNWWPARVTRPVQRIKSPLHHFNACRPKWCSRQDLHLHWRRSRRRASALGYASCWRSATKMEPPAGAAPAGLLYKRNPQAAAWRRKWSQSPVLPWTERAYETCLSAGSTAVFADRYQNGAPTRNCTELPPIPMERIADNALRASKLVGARRLARPRLPDSKSGGSAIPREPRADEIGVLDRLRSRLRSEATAGQAGDLLHERQACWLNYTTGTKW